jgi:CHASE1-domain containing sensor protein
MSLPIEAAAHIARGKRHYMIVGRLVALGFSLSILAFILVVRFERARHKQVFESKAASRVAALQSEIISHINAVNSVQSLFSATESVSRSDFGIFVRNEFAVHTAIQALEWVPLVQADERDRFEASIQAEGFQDT